MSPELQLVIAASAIPPSRQGLSCIEQLTSTNSLDWDVVLMLAAAHGVRPALLRNLVPFMPAGPLDRLQSECAALSAHNLFLAGELVRVMPALVNAGLPVVAFKGPVLAQQLYGDVSLREFSDLDLQVPRHRIWEAVERLRQHGYDCEPGPVGRVSQAFIDSECELMMTHPAGHTIDLHWTFSASFYRPFPIDSPSAPHTLNLFGVQINTLSPVDSALFAIGHFYRHGCWSVKGVADTAAVLGRLTAGEWHETLEAATARLCRRMALFATGVCAHFHHMPLPPEAGFAPDSVPRWLTRGISAIEAMIACAHAGTPGSIARLRLRLSQIDSLSARARHAAHWLLAPRKSLWRANPDRAFMLHRLTSPLAVQSSRRSV
jgi:hypothetical protein